MKSIHLVFGSLWLVMIFCFILHVPWAWWGMVACAAAGLWYLPFGTLLSVIQLVLLVLPPLRAAPSVGG